MGSLNNRATKAPGKYISITPSLILLCAIAYYGFSIYVDVLTYNVTDLGIFIYSSDNLFPSPIYLYSWLMVLIGCYLCISLFSALPARKYEFLELRSSWIAVLIGYLLFTYIFFFVLPNALNRADLLLTLNKQFGAISVLLPITIWLMSFNILLGSRRIAFFSFILILLFSLALVDRSYLIFGIFALMLRQEKFNIFLLLSIISIGLVIFTLWKVVLFWLVFDVDFFASLENVQIGLARVEAITSQSIFINCTEYQVCPNIAFTDWLSSFVGRVLPSVIYEGGMESPQTLYLKTLFPEIAAKGGGLGFNPIAEMGMVFNKYMAPLIIVLFLMPWIVLSNIVQNRIVSFIFIVYFFRFFRVDLATGIKGMIVFGLTAIIALFLFNLISNFFKLRNSL